jgi:hypothetical protein
LIDPGNQKLPYNGHVRLRLFLGAMTLSLGSIGFCQVKSISQITRTNVSVGPDGKTDRCDISGDGRLVVFDSYAENLTSVRARNGVGVFLLDRTTGNIRRLSNPARPGSYGKISSNGKVSFFSNPEVFAYDRTKGSTTAISYLPNGRLVPGQCLGSSADGNLALMVLKHPGIGTRYYVRNITSGHSLPVDVDAMGLPIPIDSQNPQITRNGSYVYFTSYGNIWRKRLSDGQLESVNVYGGYGYHVSDDGSRILYRANFGSARTYHIPTKTDTALNRAVSSGLISGDGKFVMATVDDGNVAQLSRYDVAAKTWQDIGPKRPFLSVHGLTTDGRVAATIVGDNALQSSNQQFFSGLVLDVASNAERFPIPSQTGGLRGEIRWVSLSRDGKRTSFLSNSAGLATNVPGGQYQAYVHDETGKIRLGSANSDGSPVRGEVVNAAISRSGKFLAYQTFRDSQSYGTLVIRDLDLNKNVLVQSISRYALDFAVADDGTAAYVAYDPFSTGNEVWRASPGAQTNIRISDRDHLGNPIPGISWSVWIKSAGDEIYFAAESATNNRLQSFYRWQPGEAMADLVHDRLAEIVNDVSEDGKLILLTGTNQTTGKPQPQWRFTDSGGQYDIYLPQTSTEVFLSANGNYVASGPYVYQIDRQKGWVIPTDSVNRLGAPVNPVGISNNAAPLVLASDAIGPHLITGSEPQLAYVQLGAPETDLITLVSPVAPVKGTSKTIFPTAFNWKTGYVPYPSFQYRLPGGEWSTAAQSLKLPLPADQTYSFDIRAVLGTIFDLAPSLLSVRRDTTLPEIIGEPVAGTTTVQFDLTSEMVDWKIWVQREGTSLGFKSNGYSEFVSTGFSNLSPNTEYRYQIRALDEAGNYREKLGTFRTNP